MPYPFDGVTRFEPLGVECFTSSVASRGVLEAPLAPNVTLRSVERDGLLQRRSSAHHPSLDLEAIAFRQAFLLA